MRAAMIAWTTGLVTLAWGSSSTARAEGISVGGGLVYGTEAEKVGLQLNGYYDLSEAVMNLRVGGAFNYFFVQEGLSYSALNANAQYVFLRPDALMVYGLAGLNLTFVSVETPIGDVSNTEIGLNLGIGAEYSVAEQVGLFAEIKYVISEADQAVIGLGARYRF